MAQNPLAATIAKKPSNAQTPVNATIDGYLATVKSSTGAAAVQTLDPNGNLPVHSAECNSSRLNITAETLVKSGAGKIGKLIVVTAGSAPGKISDALATPAAANLVYNIPNTVGIYALNFPLQTGLLVTPGTGGQVVAVSYD